MSLHTCYVLVITERDGDVLLIPFAKPEGGQESLADIQQHLDKWIANFAKLATDKAGAYIAWCRDNPEKAIHHFIVNHNQTKEFGFTW